MKEVLDLIKQKKLLVDQVLEHILTKLFFGDVYREKIASYNVFPGGKRLRPILAILLYEMFRGQVSKEFVERACALEFLHICTLMLDDLPCMDNADMRHLKPTTHKVFGEANAILVSMGLAVEAFALLSQKFDGIEDGEIISLVNIVSQKVGLGGLIGGQCADLDHGAYLQQCVNDQERLDYIALRKTAALFEASALVAAHLGRFDDMQKSAIVAYARNFGVAFQIYDDIVDVQEDTVLTFVSVYGIERSHVLLARHVEQACDALSLFTDRSRVLCMLVRILLERSYEKKSQRFVT